PRRDPHHRGRPPPAGGHHLGGPGDAPGGSRPPPPNRQGGRTPPPGRPGRTGPRRRLRGRTGGPGGERAAAPPPGRPDPGQPAACTRLTSKEDAHHPLAVLVEPVLAAASGDEPAALAAIEQRLPHPDAWTRAMLRLVRAVLLGNAGDPAGMGHDLELAVAGFRAVGERAGLAWALTSLADVRTNGGAFREAVSALEEAVHLLRELDPSDDAAHQRVWLAEARARAGDTATARADLEPPATPPAT